MEQQRHKRLYGLHEWTGILIGLFLYVVSFTGTVALFHDEFAFWEAPEYRTAVTQEGLVTAEEVLEGALESYPAGTEFQNLFLQLPSPTTGTYELFGRAQVAGVDGESEPKAETIHARWNAATGDALPERGDGLAHWTLDLHRHLMLPNRTIGRFLVGLAGLVMLVSIVSGVLTHRKILKELFTLRVGRSKRLQWKDTHNALGAWALPFHAMIAFSGAYLGLVVLLLPIFAYVAFNGDQEAAIAAVIGKPAEAAGVEAAPYPLSAAIDAVRDDSGYAPRGIRIEHYGDANARYQMFLPVDDRLQMSATVDVHGATGAGVERAAEAVAAGGTVNATGAETVLNALVALHYATFGGIWLKILYVALGIGLCVMIATGLMVWVERRANGPTGRLSPGSYLAISRLNTGVMIGMLPATAILFYVDRLAPVTADTRLATVGWTFMLTWLAVILGSLAYRRSRVLVRAVLTLTGALMLGILPLDLLTFGSQIFEASQRVALGVDLGAGLLGALAVLIGLGLDRFHAPAQLDQARSLPAMAAAGAGGG